MTDFVDLKDWPDYVADITIDDIDMRPVLEETATAVVDKVGRNFLGATDAAFVPWEPLKPSTVARKGHAIILVETGRLTKSATQKGHPDHIRQIDSGKGGPHLLTIGTDVEYGIFHQEGTTKLPQREFMAIGAETVDIIADKVADHIIEKLKQ